MDIKTNFIAGKMNKSVDERLIPAGQYIDALNVRLGSTEGTEIGAVENSKGNTVLTAISYNGSPLSNSATCIGAFEDGVNENIYWFLHDPANATSLSGKVDMVLSFNTVNQTTVYHIISESVLNFNPQYLITGVDLIENLLFFTDDYNAPRRINITRGYPIPTVSGDQITNEEINVIVKPPGFSSYSSPLGVVEYDLATPTLVFLNVAGAENYLEDKFLCFAYRYQYREFEYSATSLFTQPAFEAGSFFYDLANFDNAGMKNIYNSVDIGFNTGGPLVIAVEVLFKESGKNTINVIERFDKKDMGWADNNTQTIRFTNSKIYSVLGSDELLRQYDNVPRFAKAQTIMGNRLIYGNYIDQYDIATVDGQKIAIDYTTEGSSENIQQTAVPFGTVFQGTKQNIIDSSTSLFVPFSQGTWNLPASAIPLPIPAFSEFTLRVKITSTAAYDSSSPNYLPLGGDTTNADFPTGFKTNTLANQLEVEVRFFTRIEYATFDAFTACPELAEAIGTGVPGTSSSTITLIDPAASYGYSLTDQFYKLIQAPTTPAYPVDYEFKTAGIWTAGLSPNQEGFRQSIASGVLSIQAPSVQYQSATGVNVYEYFAFSTTSIIQTGLGASTDCNITFTSVSNSLSLHSNRNFETGIMYMDDFGRSSTVLVSPNNTVFFQAGESISINKIIATINNRPPYWASRYKFFIKPSLGAYNNIYSNEIFTDIADGSVSWVRLQGSATSIVSKGDVLTVKIQSNGTAVNRFITTTVLEIEAKASTNDPNLPAGSPAGLYMKIRPQGFAASTAKFSLINEGFMETEVSSGYPKVEYPLFLTDSTGATTNYSVPRGSEVVMTFRGWRGYAYFAKCNADLETRPKRFITIAANDAIDFKDFFDQEGLDPANFMESLECFPMQGVYFPAIYNVGSGPADPVYNSGDFQMWFTQDIPGDIASPLYINVRTGVPPVNGPFGLDKRPSHAEAQIIVNRNNNFMAFETKPAVADADLYFESSEIYKILPDVNGELAHTVPVRRGSQQQVISTLTPAIVELPFSDVYAFGNGVESFKYKDLAAGNFFRIGERVSAVSNTLFKEADRFAGLTYSGVFSGSSNLNNLNEFNLGLVNFKDCELVFGPIMKLHARQTDILVLQEDKISYVLANKNIISDSVGGGAIVSVPEILGQQVARIEEYGISFNPESFASWGRDMFFSDAKRGAILKLSGGGMKSDQLEVISTFGMRSYFRDKFAAQLTTQKLGGYDPYMDEYVFAANNTPLPIVTPSSACGQVLVLSNTESPLVLTVDVTTATGDFNVVYNATDNDSDVNIVIDWNNNVTTNNNVISDVTITIDKTLSFPSTATITVTPNVSSSYELTVECVATQPLSLVYVVLSSPIMSGKNLHYEFNWNNTQYYSVTESNPVTFGTDFYSVYQINFGQASVGLFPGSGSTVTMRSNKIFPDNTTFDPTENRFYVIPDDNLPAVDGDSFDLTLLQPANTLPLTPITGSLPDPVTSVDQLYQATSDPISITSSTQTLYLVWDLRDRRVESLCSGIDANNACVGCSANQPCIGPNNFIMDPTVQTTQALACNGGVGPNGIYANNPGAYVGFWHTGVNGQPSTNEPLVGDVAYKACGSDPNNCCFGGVVADIGFYFSRAQSVIEVGANGAVLSVCLYDCTQC